MAEIFTVTASLKAAVATINNVELTRLPKLLQRILPKLHLPKDAPFTRAEEEALAEALELEASQLSLMLETVSFIFETATYHQMSPQALQKQLVALGLGEEQVDMFGKVWSKKGADVVSKFRDRAFFPTKLSGVNWNLNLQMAQQSAAKVTEPNALFELSLEDTTTETTDKVKMEFNHEELFQFYNQLEQIQAQLDTLS